MNEATTESNEPMTPRQKRILIITGLSVLILVTLVTLLIWRLRSKHEEETKVTPVVSVKVAKAQTSEIASEVIAVGTIWPKEKAEVAAKISAQIKSMRLLKNQLVKAGEVIAVLESKDLQAQRAEALAAVNEAKANERQVVTGTIPQSDAEDQKTVRDATGKVANTRATYERRRALFEKGGISQKELEASQLEYQTAENELRLAQQRVALRTKSLNPNDRALAAARTAQAVQHLATLDAQLSYATIRAPITGIVTDQFQYEGEFASAGAKLVTIADISQVIVKAPFSDTAVAELKVGDAASVIPTDTSAEELKGQVSLLSRSSDATNRTVEVWVTLGNGAGTLRANGAAQVKVFANAKRDAIVVPTSAVSLDASNANEGTVMVVDAQSIAHETRVTVGTRTKDSVEITEGLKGDETIVIEGNFALADGTKVEVAAPEDEEKSEDEKGEEEKKP
jgi:HlyD family secretion protein